MNNILHTYGDSHASHHGGWERITIPGLMIKINHLTGKLMHSFGRDSMDVVKILMKMIWLVFVLVKLIVGVT